MIDISKKLHLLQGKSEVHLCVLLWIRKDKLRAISIECNPSILEKERNKMFGSSSILVRKRTSKYPRSNS